MAAIPHPPQEKSLQNVIDKLANFVARNGPEFEKMTMKKQRGNPKFSFLFGGEHHLYYKWKLGKEKAAQIQRQVEEQQKQLQSIGQQRVQESIEKAPWQQQQQQQSNWTPIQQDVAAPASSGVGEPAASEESTALPDMSDFDHVLVAAMETCKKEAIQNCKSWIFSYAQSDYHCYHVAQYLYYRAAGIPNVPFSHKLHLVYVVNDVVHHCVRKKNDTLHQSLEGVVVPIFCSAVAEQPTEQEKSKLQKVLNIWQGNGYFSSDILQKMRDGLSSHQKNDDVLMHYHLPVDYSQKPAPANPAPVPVPVPAPDIIPPPSSKPPLLPPPTAFSSGGAEQPIPPPYSAEPSGFNAPSLPLPPLPPPPPFNQGPMPPPPPPGAFPGAGGGASFMAPPPPQFPLPPPPVNPQPPQYDQNGQIIPDIPYYELPAGLMVSLVKPSDTNCKPIDPMDIRLPPALPPSQHLIDSVDAFYDKTKPTDEDGWENGGLDEFYKMKRTKERRKRSRSPSPRRWRDHSESPRRRREYSRSPSPHRRRRSRSPRRRRSRSRSPRRSASPKFVSPFVQSASLDNRISEDNKGHQMLKKMGWGETGLGASKQGIYDPVEAAEVRTDLDKFRGVGMKMNDEFDMFRKAKSYTYNRGSTFAAGRADLK